MSREARSSTAESSRYRDERLEVMRRLTWDFEYAEPVWEYGTHYWLHTLASWFWLQHQSRIVPLLDQGANVIVDGWTLKHWARFRLHTQPSISQLTNPVFRSLPIPDVILLLPPASLQMVGEGSKRIKPSERGAFAADAVGQQGFHAYQDATYRQMQAVAAELGATGGVRVLRTEAREIPAALVTLGVLDNA